MPEERYSDDEPPPSRRPHDDNERGGRYEDRDFRQHGDIPNYLVQSILVTLCCCLPFGIVAIVNAAKVNSLIEVGDYEKAQSASDEAKKWCTIGLVCGVIANALVIALQIMTAIAEHR